MILEPDFGRSRRLERQQAAWARRRRDLPTYSARELASDFRGWFTSEETGRLTKMDAFLARHLRLVKGAHKHPQAVIDLRAARRELEGRIRAEALGFYERFRVRRAYRATVEKLQLGGARRAHLAGTLILHYRQKALYRFGTLQRAEAEWAARAAFRATGRTQALLDEARRQCSARRGPLFYEPGRDPRLAMRPELKRLQAAGLARPGAAGAWQLSARALAEKCREAPRPLLGEDTLRTLHARYAGAARAPGWQPVAADTVSERRALGELAAHYPRAARETRSGFELNARQLRSALRADERRYLDQHRPGATARADHRLAQALAQAQSRGREALYRPHADPSGRGAPLGRYLQRLAGQAPRLVRFARGEGFLIRREAALGALADQRRALRAYQARAGTRPGELAPGVLDAFARHGRAGEGGAWVLAPGDTNTRRPDVLVWHLHRGAALWPEAVTQRPDGAYVLAREACERHALPGTRAWTARVQTEERGLSRMLARLPSREQGFLAPEVALAGDAATGRAPLAGRLSASTRALYRRAAVRLKAVPWEARPAHLAARAEVLSRNAWWVEHAVTRRELRALELAAAQARDTRLQGRLAALVRGVEAMDYERLRRTPIQRAANAARRPVPEKALAALKARVRETGDQELHDALVVHQATGLRPAELARGVGLARGPGTRVRVSIRGAKRAAGQEGEARFRAERGADREVEVDSPELAALAERCGETFRPQSSPDALRARLREARAEVPGAEGVRFYSFRHAMTSRLEAEGASRAEIARVLGHRSQRSQAAYGLRA